MTLKENDRMKINYSIGHSRILYSRIDKTIKFNGWANLVKTIYNDMLQCQWSFSALDNELIRWFEKACELQPELSEKEYFDIDDLKLTEKTAKQYLDRLNGANGMYGFNYYIIEDEED